jgi:hypothetical protein
VNENQPVEVYTTNNPAEAQLRRNMLVGEGIKCELDSENQAGLLGLVDVHLLVRAWDEGRARRILAGHSHRHPVRV